MNDTQRFTQRFTHRDLLRLSHPKLKDSNLAAWILGNEFDVDALPDVIRGFEAAKGVETEKALLEVIQKYNLSWEMIPNDKRSAEVWKALVNKGMPLGALLRQLPTLTRQKVLQPLSDELFAVTSALRDVDKIKKARLHPINILLALKVYESGGRYSRGDGEYFVPDSEVLDALNDAFYLAFVNADPTGQKFLLALDTSWSMHDAGVNNSVLTSAEAVGALALVIQKTERQTHTVTFTSSGRAYSRDSGISPLDISRSTRLDDVIRKMHTFDNTWGGTDCALPMTYALENKLEVDVFAIMTDNDTWAGRIHPHEALQKYRKAVNPRAKLVVLATSPSRFSIADPKDAGMLDIAGFDSAVPTLLAEFSRN